MATYPKKLKPFRSYPANVVHAIRVSVQQVNPDPSLGQVALTNNNALHVGTIPAGATVLPAFSSVKTVFAPTSTIDVGSQATPGLFMPTATIAPGTAANVANVMGTGMGGPLAADTPVFILMGTATATAGAGDFIIPFYCQKD
jgi:hypothetical protein